MKNQFHIITEGTDYYSTFHANFLLLIIITVCDLNMLTAN